MKDSLSRANKISPNKCKSNLKKYNLFSLNLALFKHNARACKSVS